MTPQTLDKWKILPRLMMLVMTGVYIRCIEWALSQPDLSTQQAGLISVITGAMTGSFAIWMGSEKKEERITRHDDYDKELDR
jgi:hypothetical protein